MYIESVAIQNFVLDYLIGASAYRFLCLRRSWWRLLLAAMVGCAASLFYPLLSLPVWASVLIKLGMGFVLSAVLFAGKCRYIKGITAFYVFTFVYGGCVLFIGCLRYGSFMRAMENPLSVRSWAVVAAAGVLYSVLRRLCISHRRAKAAAPLIYRYRMLLAGREISGNGFLDTGNRLYDSGAGLPVIVLGVKTLLPYLTEEETANLLTGHAEKVFAGARRMRCGSVGGGADLILVQPERFEVYLPSDKNILYDVTVGLSFAALSDGESYDMILHPALADGI